MTGSIFGWSAWAWCLMSLTTAGLPATVRQPEANAHPQFSFHHVHLNDPRAPFLLEFYERLFDPAVIRRVRVAESDGLQSGSMLLLIDRAPEDAPQATALWHFGWGDVSLGETYLAHARKEVAWEPPLPPGSLHLHVRSVSPSSALHWYRDVLGLRVQIAPPIKETRSGLPRPEDRMPEGLAWIGETAMLIYRTEPPLLSSRGQQVDHIALGCADLDRVVQSLGRAGVRVIAEPGRQSGRRSVMIEGPDRLAIEIVETP